MPRPSLSRVRDQTSQKLMGLQTERKRLNSFLYVKMITLNKHFGYQMLRDLLEMWCINSQEYFGGRVSQLNFYVDLKLCNLEVEKYTLFSFSTKTLKGMIFFFYKFNNSS